MPSDDNVVSIKDYVHAGATNGLSGESPIESTLAYLTSAYAPCAIWMTTKADFSPLGTPSHLWGIRSAYHNVQATLTRGTIGYI